MKQYYRIAGLFVEMESFGRTLSQAAPYAVSAPPSVDVRIDRCPPQYRDRHPECSEDLCEYLYTGMMFYRQLINFGGMMLHSSAVAVDGKAYLFSAPCGTGKSTHTALYLREFGARACILNDDKPALRLEDGAFYAYGTPWSGKDDKNENLRVPLGGICFLSRGERNEIRRVYGKDAFFGIYAQTLRPKHTAYAEKLLDVIKPLIETVPIWALACTPEPEAAHLSYSAMSNPEAWG